MLTPLNKFRLEKFNFSPSSKYKSFEIFVNRFFQPVDNFTRK